jgi:type VI secretion system protein ImpC
MRLREPYRLDGAAAWPYRENLYAPDKEAAGRRTALWGHAGWAYMAGVMRTFAGTGWVYSLDEREDGTAPAPLADGDARPMAAEVYIGASAAARLAEMGVCVACAERGGTSLDFVRPATLFRMPRSLRAGSRELLPSGDSLPAILAVSRMAHFLKTAARYKAGSFVAEESKIQSAFSGWLKDYVSDRDGDPARPLAKQEVKVEEIGEGGPGRFRVRVNVWLKPVWGRRREGDFDFPLSVGGG